MKSGKETTIKKPITVGPECVPCLVRAATEMIYRCYDNHDDMMESSRRVLKLIAGKDFGVTPVEISDDMNCLIREETGNFDPYLEMKRQKNRRALEVLPKVRKQVKNYSIPFMGALLAAAAGNILDQVAGDLSRMEESLDNAFERGFVLDSYDEFCRLLEKAKNVLYVADNSGEIVFDRLPVEMIHEMGKKITFCVRGGPAVDDALEEDWRAAGLDSFSKLVTTGSTALGCPWNRMGDEFKTAFKNADLIIAKGMGNYETLGHIEDNRLFIVLMAKCRRVAEPLKVRVGDLCFYHGAGGGNILNVKLER